MMTLVLTALALIATVTSHLANPIVITVSENDYDYR